MLVAATLLCKVLAACVVVQDIATAANPSSRVCVCVVGGCLALTTHSVLNAACSLRCPHPPTTTAAPLHLIPCSQLGDDQHMITILPGQTATVQQLLKGKFEAGTAEHSGDNCCSWATVMLSP